MALARYGVLSGILVSHARDIPVSQGRWFQVNLTADLFPRAPGLPVRDDVRLADAAIRISASSTFAATSATSAPNVIRLRRVFTRACTASIPPASPDPHGH